MSKQLKNRVMGSLLGLAWGDVFGAPVEFWTEAQIKRCFGEYYTLPNNYTFSSIPVNKRNRLRPLGFYTDDTQQCLALIQTLGVRNFKYFSAELWAQILVRGMDEKVMHGYGAFFDKAVKNLKDNQVNGNLQYKKSGSISSGIGSAMRIGAIGAIDMNINELRKIVIESTLVTHATIHAVAIAYAVAYAVHALLEKDSDVNNVKLNLPGEVRVVEDILLGNTYSDWEYSKDNPHVVSETLENVFKLTSTKEARNYLEDNAGKHFEANPKYYFPYTNHINDPLCVLGGIHAIYMGLMETDDPQKILSELVSLGGDTDTVGAICGSILGARFGLSWIPLNKIRFSDVLLGYADDIFEKKMLRESFTDFLKRERILG